MATKVTTYEIIKHGIENTQYFQGCGTSFTEYAHVVTGCGDNPKEAFDDALEQIDSDIDASDIEPITDEKPSVSEEHRIEVSNNLGDYVDAEEYEELLLDDDAYTEKVSEIMDDQNNVCGNETYYYLSIRYNVE